MSNVNGTAALSLYLSRLFYLLFGKEKSASTFNFYYYLIVKHLKGWNLHAIGGTFLKLKTKYLFSKAHKLQDDSLVYARKKIVREEKILYCTSNEIQSVYEILTRKIIQLQK